MQTETETYIFVESATYGQMAYVYVGPITGAGPWEKRNIVDKVALDARHY